VLLDVADRIVDSLAIYGFCVFFFFKHVLMRRKHLPKGGSPLGRGSRPMEKLVREERADVCASAVPSEAAKDE
jgi:hypothetical protein